MPHIRLDNKIGFFVTSGFYGVGSGLAWILTTGFWVDDNVWLDEQVWNDGV